ncbi:MAG: hypothetical protein GTN53_06240, partial [Candidatus Aminicenantes bacterium]|nr:hypothetical protein [Gammaproteobacteria bacterium]NIO80140.1 hypothetical protein [Candidatus Aminicenantes bacterium]NIQ66093.1 hypothetical protein [Candidatus Aminicenantes bacterium]NIT22089.1 hypothetical protein [Candidatus Aminicenantes bacterium]
MIFAGELCYIPDNYYYVFPVPVSSNVTISEKDLVTGDILLKKEIQTPSLPGQVYSFQGIPGEGDFSSDITPPLIVQSQGLLIFGFDVSGQVVEYRDVTFTPQTDTMGHVIGMEIKGKPGTSVVKRSDDPAGLPRGLIRVYKLVIINPEESNRYEYQLISSIDANGDGSFFKTLLAEEPEGEPLFKEGDRVLITVEKGGIPLDQEFVLVFSEPLYVNVDINNINMNTNINSNETLEPGIDLPITIKDITQPDSPENINIQTRLLNSGTEVRIKPLSQLKENHVYILQTFDETRTELPDLMDCSGNPLHIQCNFRAKRSYNLYFESTNQEVYDTELIGSRLFVAAGYDGLRVLDVSYPSHMRTMLTVPTLFTLSESQESIDIPLVFPDRVNGLAQYVEKEVVIDPDDGKEKIIEHRFLVVVGGGNKNLGYIKLVNLTELENPANLTPELYQYKSQIISDSHSDAISLPQGYPRRVKVFGKYAFVSITNSGLVVVDLEQMQSKSNRYNLNAIIRYHPEDLINDAAVYRGLLKNPDIEDDPGKEEIIAVLLVNYHGLKLLALNRSETEDPGEPDKYKKYLMKEVGDYNIGINHHFTNLVLAEDYWVDIDEDGRGEIDEDNDIQIDQQRTGQNITGKDETRDVVFFAIPTIRQLVIVDVTEIYYKEDASGKRIDEGRWQPGWSLNFRYVKDAQGYYAGNMREMQLGREDRVLYVTDINMGVMVVDAHLTGRKLFRNWETFMKGPETGAAATGGEEAETLTIIDLFSGFYGVHAISNPESWYLGDINTTGKSQFGLLIDEDLNMAVVGQQSKGVDIVKLAQPEITFVKKEENAFMFTEVRRMSPSGTLEDELDDNDNDNYNYNDNPEKYPDEVYIMALLPGDIAKKTGEPTIVYCDAWSLNSAHAPMIPWYNQNQVKTYMKKVALVRQSDNPLDPWYRVFLSAPIRITLDPYEDREIKYRDRQNYEQTSNLRMLSGD